MTAEFRSVQTRMWREDEWFQDLPTDARLLFIYLFTNPSASVSGIYRLPLRTMEFESGLTQARIKELLADFSAAGKAHYADGVVWVVRMRENQLPGKISWQVAERLRRDIDTVPDCTIKTRYLSHYGYPIDTVSIPVATETDTDTDTIQKQKQINDADGRTDETSKMPETTPHTNGVPVSVPLVVAERSDADMTQAIAAKLESVGVCLSPYMVDTYVAAATEHGIHATLAGITAAAEQGKQQKTSYVLACIRNKAAGDERKSSPHTNGNGNGYMTQDEQAKLAADARAAKQRIATSQKLGVKPSQKDLDIVSQFQTKGMH